MNESLILSELKRLSSAVEALQAAVHQALNPQTLRGAEVEAVDALGRVFGASAVTTREIRMAAAEDFGDRPALRKALEGIAPGLRAAPLGMALAGIADRGGCGREWRLQKASSEKGSRVWAIGPKGA